MASTVVARWRAKLAVRKSLLAHARLRAAYWRKRKAHAKKGTKTYSRAAAMLADREKLVAKRKEQVAYADRVIARHAPKAKARSVSEGGVQFVAGFEGFRSFPYRDAVGVWTIGYGETQGVGPNTPMWTKSYALSRLRTRLNRDYLAPVLRVADAVGLRLSQHEADALASLSYNLGPGIFAAGHTMGDALRSKNRTRIADAFLVYDKAGGHALAGLTRRRRAERAMFLQG